MKKHLQLPSLTTFLIFAVILGCTAGASDPASTNTDLSNYYTKPEADTKFATKQDLELGSVSNDPDIVYGVNVLNYCAYRTSPIPNYSASLSINSLSAINPSFIISLGGIPIYKIPATLITKEINLIKTNISSVSIAQSGTNSVSCKLITCSIMDEDIAQVIIDLTNLVNNILDNAAYDGRFANYTTPDIALFDLKDNRFKPRCTS